MTDTIAAISTPFGEGAIAMIRLSGEHAIAVAGGVFQARKNIIELASKQQQLGRIVEDGAVIDEVVVSVQRAPSSYTGEDVVEINCHGGMLVTQRILELLLDRGARSAQPGEFTQRAFLNGKMDLTQAEAVMDLINAQTDLALQAATEQLEGRLGARVREVREELLEVLAHLEASIDFSEEGIDPSSGPILLSKVNGAHAKIISLLGTAHRGKILREGVRTVIYGAPNVGKSSLLNLLLGYERAIVSELPGTTRDTIEEVINLRGIPMRLIDTAGIRESGDAIEQAGIARTLQNVERADLVLHLADVSLPRVGEAAANGKELLVLNKCDLGEDVSWSDVPGVRISCRHEQGLDLLEDAICERVFGAKVKIENGHAAINARHHACLKSAAEFTEAARQALAENVSPEFVALDVRAALDAVGDVVGRVDDDEVLGKIFSTFCIGK